MKKLLFLFFCFALSVSAFSQESQKPLARVCQWINGESLWGYMDMSGAIVIPSQYQDARPFSEGLARVKKEDKWGYIDSQGEVVIPFQFPDNDFDGEYNENFDEYFDRYPFGSFFDGLAAIKDENDNYGFINKNGEIVIPCQFVGVLNFSEGATLVESEDGKPEIINTKGESIKSYEVDEESSIILGDDKFHIRGYSEQMLMICDKDYDKFGFMTIRGDITVPCQFDDAGVFSEGLARVVKDGKWGFINKQGEIVISCQFDEVNDFSDGLARVNNGGDWGFIDRQGTMVIPFQEYRISDFSEGLAQIYKLESIDYINKKGETVISITNPFNDYYRFKK